MTTQEDPENTRSGILTKQRRRELYDALKKIPVPTDLTKKEVINHIKDEVVKRLNDYSWPNKLIDPILENVDILVHVERRSTKVTPGFKGTLNGLF